MPGYGIAFYAPIHDLIDWAIYLNIKAKYPTYLHIHQEFLSLY